MKLPVVLPYLPAPRADPSPETSPYSPCVLQASPGSLYISKLLYLYFEIRRGYHREAHQVSFGVSPPTSCLAALSHSSQSGRDQQRGQNSPPSKSESLKQSRASGCSSLQAQLWGWGSAACGRVLRCGRNQNSKPVTWILAHEHSREMLPC